MESGLLLSEVHAQKSSEGCLREAGLALGAAMGGRGPCRGEHALCLRGGLVERAAPVASGQKAGPVGAGAHEREGAAAAIYSPDTRPGGHQLIR